MLGQYQNDDIVNGGERERESEEKHRSLSCVTSDVEDMTAFTLLLGLFKTSHLIVYS